MAFHGKPKRILSSQGILLDPSVWKRQAHVLPLPIRVQNCGNKLIQLLPGAIDLRTPQASLTAMNGSEYTRLFDQAVELPRSCNSSIMNK